MTTCNLTEKHCVPYEGGVPKMSREDAEKMMAEIPGWKLADDALSIQRRFEFKGFYRCMAFINAMAWVANSEDHHPDLQVSYNRCVVNYSTHSVGGLSLNDFICAAYIDALIGHDA